MSDSLPADCRRQLTAGRKKLEQRFRDGLPAVQTASAMTQLYDDVVIRCWQSTLERAAKEGIRQSHLDQLALVAHGGYGRKDLSPHSDADLMLLTRRATTAAAAQVATTLVRDLNDAGLDVGFSTRTAGEARSLAWSDIRIYTTLTESRLLVGSRDSFDRFFDRFRTSSRRRRHRLNDQAIDARKVERRKWGNTNYLLRPNVKRSRGGLRDIQLVRWLGFANYGETRLDKLYRFGAMSSDDYNVLRRAHLFMLRLRHELHFRAGRCQDVLDRPTQLLIASDWGYHGRTGVLPVEDFMQDYFDHTRGVRYVSAYVADDSRARSRVAMGTEFLMSHKLDGSIRMGPHHIWVRKSDLKRFSHSLPDVLRLMQLANQHQRRIAHPTWQAIREVMQERTITPPDKRSVEAFLALLSRPGRLAPLLRRLHELRIIEQLIPAMRRCRGLLQFNAYHKYTVDAHCIRAVEAATEFNEKPETPMGRRYRRLKDKTLLHLALLIHDLGKGYEEDHSEVGRRIAIDVAEAFALDAASADTLQWLIHKHLLVNEVAFRHDLNDADVVHKFAADVGSIGRLELLVVHAVADLIAVGPDVLTDWKMGLIEDLYLRTRRYFETGNLPGDHEPELDAKREQIVEALSDHSDAESMVPIVQQLPYSLLRRHEVRDLIGELRSVANWFDDDRTCFCSTLQSDDLMAARITVVVRLDRPRVGVFARITAALASLGFTIRRANIESIGTSLLWDNFWIEDPDHPEGIPPERINRLRQRILDAINNIDGDLPKPRRTWVAHGAVEPDSVRVLPTKIVFDNDTFDHQTILSVFTYDRQGMLSDIAAAISQMDVSILFAKIDTHLDQIADVFYVTENDQTPILDLDRQHAIREAMMAAIEQRSSITVAGNANGVN
ncbi:MAG: HD domain-containing protein [Planctomycetota bacterium]